MSSDRARRRFRIDPAAGRDGTSHALDGDATAQSQYDSSRFLLPGGRVLHPWELITDSVVDPTKIRETASATADLKKQRSHAESLPAGGTVIRGSRRAGNHAFI